MGFPESIGRPKSGLGGQTDFKNLFSIWTRGGWQGIFPSGADKFLQQYCMYCKKIWQSMAEKDLPDGVRIDADQVLMDRASANFDKNPPFDLAVMRIDKNDSVVLSLICH